MKRFRGSYCSYFLMYFFYYLSLAMMQGLISVYLMDKGYSASQVSLTVSASMAVSVALQPVVGVLSDQFDKRMVCGVLLAVNGIFSYMFPMLAAFPLLAAVYSLVIAGMNSTNPVVEHMATVSRFSYGRIRVWGTIGYAVGTQVSGILYRYVSPGAMYQMCGIWKGFPVVCGDYRAVLRGRECKQHISSFHVSRTGDEHRHGSCGNFRGHFDGIPHRNVLRQVYGSYEK